MITNEMMEVCLQPIQEKFVKLDLLQTYFVKENGIDVRRFRKVGEVQGNASGGSLNINATSTMRRTCNLELVVTDSSFLIGEDRKIWMDKWFGLQLGIKSLKTGEIVWFDKGHFAIHNPSIKYDVGSRKLSLEGLDLMSTLDKQLGYITKLDAETPLADAVKTTVHVLGGISEEDIYIEQNNYVLPYDIEKSPTDTVYSILSEIRDLYMDYEIYFDENGRFIYRRIKNRNVAEPVEGFANEVVTFRFLEEHEVVIDYDYKLLFDNVANHIEVWGKLRDDGLQIHETLINTNPASPFNINTSIGVRPLSIVDDRLFTSEQALTRADYEYYLHNNFNETASINLSPLYFLEVNNLIEFDKPEIGLSGKFLIDSISLPLGIGTSSISAHKVYEVE